MHVAGLRPEFDLDDCASFGARLEMAASPFGPVESVTQLTTSYSVQAYRRKTVRGSPVQHSATSGFDAISCRRRSAWDGALKRTFARERGWNRLRLLSSAGNNYNCDYYGENSEGGQQPSLNVFVRRNGKIHHFFHSELLLVPSEREQNQRHVDMMWPLWNLLNFTPEGRGSDWYPSLTYR